jgi:hypothetical protein
MYNLLVTSQLGAWDDDFYVFDKSRFLEYTNENIASALRELSQSHINNLKSYPCLFAYEGEISDVRIGYLKAIKEQGRKLLIEFKFKEGIEPIPYSQIEPIAPLLDIRSWEMNRTHWAVKDENLFGRLRAKGILNLEVEAKLKNQKRPTIEKTKSPKISTVKGFVGKVLGLELQEGFEVFYRGHSNKVTYMYG